MMAEVLSNLALHLHAADGYKKTGATIALNGDEDDLVVRERCVFQGSRHATENQQDSPGRQS